MLIAARSAMVAARQPRLPYDAELEYLESTGTQWIDTGRPIPDDFWFDATIDITGTNDEYKTLLGARVKSNVNDYQFSFHLNDNRFLARYGTNSSQYYAARQTGMMRIRVESGGKLYINESFVAQLGVRSPSAIINMYIFALNNNGAASQQSQYIRLYNLKYGGTNEYHDFIPVRRGSVGYLYDRVSKRLFGNAGTGDFVLGPDVVPVEYLESHGAEYIDILVSGVPDEYFGIKGFVKITNTSQRSYAVWDTNSDRQFGAAGYAISGASYLFSSWVGRVDTSGGWYVTPGVLCPFEVSTLGKTTLNEFSPLPRNITSAFSTLRLFGKYTTAYSGNASVALGGLTITDGLGIERKLSPVRVGTDATSWEGAMMDVLTRRIYRNAGTGAFGYGNDLRYPIPAA